MRAVRVAAVLAVGLALQACTSDGTSLLERMGPDLEAIIFDENASEAQAGPIDRATAARIPFAFISLQTEGSPVGYAIAREVVGPYVVYQDNARRSITLQGGLITGTHGLGHNLAAVMTHPDDPVAHARPLGTWPDRHVRSYQFSIRASKDHDITVHCAFRRVAKERIEIVEQFFDVTRVEETCTNGARTFGNVYWVEPDTGFIWRSRQWIGPLQELYTLEIIRPFG